MKKSKLIILVALMLVMSACGNKSKSESGLSSDDVFEGTSVEIQNLSFTTENGKVEFIDSLGRKVSVANPQRVVTLLGSFADEWILAGGNIVGTVSDTFKNYDYKLDKDVVDLGSHNKIDAEKIIALNPDFVICSSKLDAQVALTDTLEKAGIVVAYFDVDSFDDYLKSLKLFTQITGKKNLYEKYGTDVKKQIDKAKSQIDQRKPTVLFIRTSASSVKVKGSRGTVGGEILADLDTVNIADSNSKLEDLSIEAILEADPDYIFVTTQGSEKKGLANVDKLLTSNPAWKSLKAVKNNNYYVIDKKLYNSKPNARWAQAYQNLADIIYPKR